MKHIFSIFIFLLAFCFSIKAQVIEMVSVKGGLFSMGNTITQVVNVEDDELPVHDVFLDDYQIGRYEVTQKEWEEVMGSNPSVFKGEYLPVDNVSWDDIQVFITKLNKKTGKKYRLPTEAEWEYAARGGVNSKNALYAGHDDISNVAWYNGNSKKTSHQVGTKTPNELGIYDMSGNVYEWCQDGYSGYVGFRLTNPKGLKHGKEKVIRGGSWNHSSEYCRVSNRFYAFHSNKKSCYGFRLAL